MTEKCINEILKEKDVSALEKLLKLVCKYFDEKSLSLFFYRAVEVKHYPALIWVNENYTDFLKSFKVNLENVIH